MQLLAPRAGLAAALLLAALALAACQTYTPETAPGVTAYSAFANGPAGGSFAPYVYSPPPNPVAGAGSPTGCSGIGGTCVPVTVSGSAATGFYLSRNGAPYWFKCVPTARWCVARAHAHSPHAPAAAPSSRRCPS